MSKIVQRFGNIGVGKGTFRYFKYPFDVSKVNIKK